MKRFIDELVSGRITAESFETYVAAWYETGSHLPIYTFLGLSWDEYKVVSVNTKALKYVVEARKSGLETGFPEIIDCSCGKDHMTVPKDTEFDDETGKSFEYELVCRTHRKHEPCRPCMSESFARKNSFE